MEKIRNAWGDGPPPETISVPIFKAGETTSQSITLHRMKITGWQDGVLSIIRDTAVKDVEETFLNNISLISPGRSGLFNGFLIIYAANEDEARREIDVAMMLTRRGLVLNRQGSVVVHSSDLVTGSSIERN